MDTVKKVENLIKKGETFLGKNLTRENPEFQAWNNSLIRFVEQQYGKDSTTYKNFRNRLYTLGICSLDTPEKEFIKAFEVDLQVTLGELKYILEELKEDSTTKSPNNNFKPTVNNRPEIVINNNNTNNNMINFNMDIREIRKVIEDNTMLSDSDKEGLTKQLDTLEELQKSKKNKNEKWKVAKGILKFVVDKGADIAIMFLPQILKALQG